MPHVHGYPQNQPFETHKYPMNNPFGVERKAHGNINQSAFIYGDNDRSGQQYHENDQY